MLTLDAMKFLGSEKKDCGKDKDGGNMPKL